MSVTGTLERRGSADANPDWPVVLGIWAVAAAVLFVRAQFQPTPLLGDTDDAMRLVQATDLFTGQGWQDNTQYRDNTPYGASIHWSRLIDAPITLLMAVATPVVGSAAPRLAAMLWPVLLLLPLLLMSLSLTRRLVPTTDLATPVVLPLVSMVLLIEFIPGRLDHHNLQILLCLMMALCLVAWREQTLGGVAAGIAAATSLAIGMETLLVIGVTFTTFGMLWALHPGRYRRPVIAFGLAFSLVTIAHLVLSTRPGNYWVVACDALSIAYVLPAAIGGGLLAGAAWLINGPHAPLRRLLIVGLFGSVALAAAALLFPQCLAGPYAGISGSAMADYFDEIVEAQSLWMRLHYDAPTAIAFALAILASVVVTIWRVRSETGERRIDWLIVLALLGSSALVMLVQMRGARIAAPFMIPAAAWVITSARRTHISNRSMRSTLSLVVAWLMFAGVAHYALATVVLGAIPSSIGDERDRVVADRRNIACQHESVYERLATLPSGRAMAELRLGPYVLVHTPHAVVAAGLHRNAQGIADARTFFESEDRARSIAIARSLDYAVTCASSTADAAVQNWGWLTPLSGPEEPLQVYRITR